MVFNSVDVVCAKNSQEWILGHNSAKTVAPSEHESKSGKKSVLEAFCVCVRVGRGVGRGVGCGWGLAAPAHPSVTILLPRVTCFGTNLMFESSAVSINLRGSNN